jgi:hypothetical protein
LISHFRDLKTVQRAAEEVKRLDSALEGIEKLKGAERKAEEQRRIGSFEVHDKQWSSEQVARLRIGLPKFIPKSPAHWTIRVVLRFRYIFNWSRYGDLLEGMENDIVADIRHAALYEISNVVETDLIDISAKLDELGFGAVGGLHYRLNRSAYYVREFNTLLKTLRVNNIPTWISYEQFVRRGLAPAFDYMKRVGKRLRAVRSRLLTITEMIETSALVGQSAATRHNTAVLRRATMFAFLLLLVYLAGSFETVRSWTTRVWNRLSALLGGWIADAYSWLPGWMKVWTEPLLIWLQSVLP